MARLDWGNGDRKSSKSVTMPDWVIARVNAAAAALKGHPDPNAPGSLSHLMSQAALTEVERLERKYNGGEPFPPVDRLQTGPGRGAMSAAWKRRRHDKPR